MAENWKNLISKKDWYEAIEEANDLIEEDVSMDIQGYDIDGKMIKAARQNAADAGVDHLIHLQRREVKDLRHPKKYGFVITNPHTGNGWKKRGASGTLFSDWTGICGTGYMVKVYHYIL